MLRYYTEISKSQHYQNLCVCLNVQINVSHSFINSLISYALVAGFSKQVKQKVSERRLPVGGLEEETEYVFGVRGVTVGAGGASEARVRTGPQPGSPASPRALQLEPTPAALHMKWENNASGKGPLLGYYIEARKKGER